MALIEYKHLQTLYDDILEDITRELKNDLRSRTLNSYQREGFQMAIKILEDIQRRNADP